MKQSVHLVNRWKRVNSTALRFPLTVLLLLAATITNASAIVISKYEPYNKITLTLGIGALIYTVCQLLYERFFNNKIYRYIFMASTLLITFLYYLIIKSNNWGTEMTVRTLVIFFILLVLLIWIPSVKSRVNFNQSFLAVFKSFFMTLFLNGILFIGVIIILAAINVLLFNVSDKAYIHSANIIFVFIAPLYFLMYIPVYSVFNNLNISRQSDIKDTSNENVNPDDYINESFYKIISPGKFLETLISYIVIPVTAVFTLILLIYIIINITGNFWTDNLLEPMLVAYSIIVIIVYLLASTINNAWTKIFRRIFPKVLVLVVLFQTVSSVMKISKYAITYGRYYVILFGIFSTIAGLMFCFKPIEKNGVIAPLLIILSLISIIPGVGAFTISRTNQINRLRTVLERNNMLVDEGIIPNSKITDGDKQIIISSLTYLNRMNYTNTISWLSDYKDNYIFEKVFGFPMYGGADVQGKYIVINREQRTPIPLEGYDFIVNLNIYNNNSEEPIVNYTKEDKNYTLRVITGQDKKQLIVFENDQTVIGSFPVSEIFTRFLDVDGTASEMKKTEEVTFVADNDKASIKVIVDNMSFNTLDITENYNAQVYVLIKIK